MFGLSRRFTRQILLTIAIMLSANELIAAEKGHAIGLEINPILPLFSLIPGVTAFGGGAEVALGPYAALTGGYDMIAFRPTDKQLEKMRADTDSSSNTPDNDPLVLRKIRAESISSGLRFYFNGWGDSFYFGGMAKFSTIELGIEKATEQYQIKGTSVAPGAELGYRWKWGSGFAMRLGGSYSVTASDKFTVTRQSTGEKLTDDEIKDLFEDDEAKSDSPKKAKEEKGQASLEVGLGFLF